MSNFWGMGFTGNPKLGALSPEIKLSPFDSVSSENAFKGRFLMMAKYMVSPGTPDQKGEIK